jgi:hypothetical protein
MSRANAIKLLWAGARKLGGEDIVRVAVAAIHDRDGTCADLKGTPEYQSVKSLSDRQLYTLAQELRRKAGLPSYVERPRARSGKRQRRPFNEGAVTYLPSPVERHYLNYLFELLAWPADTREPFILRQTKNRGLITHEAFTAVITPLESMLQRRGFVVSERDGQKTWRRPMVATPPREPDACCAKARRLQCVCRACFDCPDHGTRHIGSHD